MTALSSSAASLHRDIRSESRSYKRDKEHSTKWAAGVRPLVGGGRDWGNEPPLAAVEQHQQCRPEKKYSDLTNHPRFHNNSFAKGSRPFGRLARKSDNLVEVSSPNTLSRSLTELAPHTSPVKSARSPNVEARVLYSFDANTSPGRGVGLDTLVAKAEREWTSKETAKLVENEYEILDERGEITVIPSTKKGKRGTGRPQLVIEADDEDDWEQI